MARRGPKTDEGKSVVRFNAVRHGVLSAEPVVPGLEQHEDWEAFRANISASLAPVNPLEEILAERVAQALWRLQRIVRYERELIAIAREEIPEDVLQSQKNQQFQWDFNKTYGVEPIPADTEHERMRRMRVLPPDSRLNTIIRYEAHLNRQLYQALHELEALQARRRGEPAPLARVQLHGLPEQ